MASMARAGPRLDRHRHVGGYRAARRERRQGVLQPGVERRRVDAAGQVPQVGDGLLGPAMSFVDQAPDGGQVGGLALSGEVVELFLGLTEPHRQGDELGLGAVVEVALDASEGLSGGVERLRPRLLEAPDPGRRRVGSEQQMHHAPVEVDDQPHRPRGDEEQDHPGQEHTRVGCQPRCGTAVIVGAEQPPERTEAHRARAAGQGRGDTEECFDPDAQREPHAEDGERHLGDEVAHRPPGGPIAERRPQPPEEPRTGAERLGFGDLLAQHPPGEGALPTAEQPGGPQATSENHDADEHDGQRHSGDRQCSQDERRRAGQGGADEEESQLRPAALAEWLPSDPVGQVHGLFGSLLWNPDLHPALLGAGLIQASRFTNSTAPAARTIAA